LEILPKLVLGSLAKHLIIYRRDGLRPEVWKHLANFRGLAAPRQIGYGFLKPRGFVCTLLQLPSKLCKLVPHSCNLRKLRVELVGLLYCCGSLFFNCRFGDFERLPNLRDTR
jgi:hypothetical protein